MSLIIILSVIVTILLIISIASLFILYRQNRNLCQRALLSLKNAGIHKTLARVKRYHMQNSNEEIVTDTSEWIEYDDALSIAVKLTGGFGDYIISAKVVEELLALATCKMVVYAEKEEFARAVYASYPDTTINLRDDFALQAGRYDLAIDIEHFIECVNYRRDKVKSVSEELATRIDYLLVHYDDIYVDIEQQWYRERVRFEKCRIDGLDRWTEQRMGQTFDIADKKIQLPLLDRYRDCIERIGLADKKYITINYGADAIQLGRTQLKLWPKDNLESFVKLFHKTYPTVGVMQLGAKNADKIAGADLYVFGEKIEATKWILKNSLFHLDCEGGLVHLASQLDTKCIVLFGPTPVHMYGYEQNINLHNDECDYCMGLTEQWAYECYKGYEYCHCLKNITPEIVLTAIRQNNLIPA